MPDTASRIAKYMAQAGLCSRREAERWIEAGRVVVNGSVVETPAFTVVESDEVVVDGKPINGPATPRLWLYHKPVGLITTHHDPQGRPTVFDHLPNGLPRVVSVGRLDVNTEGLLLLTNNGALAELLAHPRTKLARTYRVRVYGEVSQAILDGLKNGLTIDCSNETITYKPIFANIENRGAGKNQWISMTIHEGKNREIRKICTHLGLEVNRLIRTHYGPFALEKLPAGQVKEVASETFKQYL